MKRAIGLSLVLVACGGNAAAPPPLPPPPPAPVATPPAPPPDPLGERPEVATPAPFAPPVPVVYTRPDGVTVWLVERHSLPIVSMELVVAHGAADDPAGKGGLAQVTANMLDEGAGKRGPLDIARDVDRLGASLRTGALADYSFVQLTSLKQNLAAASAIFGDVVVRPTFSPVEWKRVHELWQNDLKQKKSDPASVAGVVTLAAVYPPAAPYAHPTDGTTTSAAKIALEDVRSFYASAWNPKEATCVVVGDVTRAELDPLLDKALAGWKATGKPLPASGAVANAAPDAGAVRVLVVDRADAPQSVIAFARPGTSASSPDAAGLVRVNAALGGSFTSRLNQDLREEHGWSYGAKSRFSFVKGTGMFVAQAAVQTEHTGAALAAMLKDIEVYAKDGPTDEEVAKTRLLSRADLVETFESADATAHRLARNAGVGLPADHEAKAAQAVYGVGKEDMKRLAGSYLAKTNARVVIVGPRAKIQPQLDKLGITSIEARSAEGEAVK